MSPPTIMPLGDSLTAPYVPTLAKLLGDAGASFKLVGTQGTAPLNHEGHGGYRVQMIGDALEGYLAKLGGAPQYAIVCLGTNDLYSMPFPDVAKILTQWKNLIASLKARGARVVVCTIPKWKGYPTNFAETFNAGVRSYVKSNAARTKLVDLERDLSTADLSADGVHLSALGAAKMGRLIARVFSAKVPGTAKNPIAKAADELKRRRMVAIGAVVVVGAALLWH